MTQPKLITKPFADDALPGYVNEIPKENPAGAPEQNASWAVGFPPITMTDIDDGGLPPNGEDMNGVLRAITEHNLFIGGGGVYEFTGDYITQVGGYSKGAVLISDDKTALWMSIQDNNTQNFNGATKTQWRRIAFTELDSTLASIQNALNTKADKSVTITAGDGLTGGGTLAGDRVIAVNSSVVRTDRTITAGTGLSGGGNLSANRTLSVNYGTTAGTAAQGNDSRITGAAQKSANLSDLSSSAAARQNLGLGTAAIRDVGTGSGNVMEVGAFGLGSLQASAQGEFPPPVSGIYQSSITPTSTLLVLPRASNRSTYLEVDNGGGRFSLRGEHYDPSAQVSFSGLVEFFHTGNIQTTTGQSTEFPMTQKAVTDALNTKANTTTQVVAGTGLSGGGSLSTNRTLSVNYGSTAGTAAQGNDSRITGAAQKSANLSDLSSASAARQNLGLGTAATRDVGTGDGNVMEVGAFGLGGNAAVNSISYGDPISGFGYAKPNPALKMAGPFLKVHGARGFIISARGYIVTVQTTGESGDPVMTLIHTSNIQSTTGQSTEYPMTQKAVTDAINNSAIGVGQTWQDVLASRNSGTNYTNSTGKPIAVSVQGNTSTVSVKVGGVTIKQPESSDDFAFFIVPNGESYSVDCSNFKDWAELR